MSEPRAPQTTPASEGLTTEQLANAAAKGGEARSFAAEAGRHPGGDQPERDAAPIFPESEAAELRRAWAAVQAGFVDEPRRAAEEADHLVATAIKRLAEIFADERATLEAQWSRGDQISTEELRVALQRYRSFFGRLLSI